MKNIKFLTLIALMISLSSCAVFFSAPITSSLKNKYINVHKPITLLKDKYPDKPNRAKDYKRLNDYSLEASTFSLFMHIKSPKIINDLDLVSNDSAELINLTLAALNKSFKKRKNGEFNMIKAKNGKCKGFSIPKRLSCLSNSDETIAKVFSEMGKKGLNNLIIPVNVGLYVPDETGGSGNWEDIPLGPYGKIPFYVSFWIFNFNEKKVFFNYTKYHAYHFILSTSSSIVIPFNWGVKKASLRFLGK